MRGRVYIALAGGLAASLALAAPAPAATIEVTETDDELGSVVIPDCSLREAVQAANTNSAVDGCQKGQGGKTDVIVLEAEVYELDIPTTDEGSNQDGDLDILSGGDLVIRGAGSQETRIETSLDDRVISHNGFEEVLTLEGLEVSGGFSADNLSGSGGNIHVQQGKLKTKDFVSTNSFGDAGGAIALDNGSDGKLVRSTVTGAGAETVGGAIVVRGGGNLTIKRSVIEENEVDQNVDGNGGAIKVFAGKLSVTDSEFLDNEVVTGGSGNNALGGAIYSGDKLQVKRSLFAGNSANGDSATSAVGGGAILHTSSEDTKIVNTTFYDNDTAGDGGAIFNNGGKVEVVHSSFDLNDADEGGHLFEASLGQVVVANSILSEPLSGGACGGLTGSVKSGGYNVFENDEAACPAKGSDEVVGDVGYHSDGLASNGGPTGTIGLKKSSAAVDLVPTGRCEKLDQRGFARPKGPACDAGALERGAKP